MSTISISTQIDNISIRIGTILLGQSITVYVDLYSNSILHRSLSYTYLYSKTIPIWYNNNVEETSSFPYYLPSGYGSYPDPTQFFSFDIYVLNGLILPSLQNDLTVGLSTFFSGITDLTTISTLPAPTITYTTNQSTNNQYNYFTINLTLPTKETNIQTNYNVIMNSNTYPLINTNTLTLYKEPIVSGQNYTIYVTSSNAYTGTTGSYQITPITVGPTNVSLNGPVDNSIYLEFSNVTGASTYGSFLVENSTIINNTGPTGLPNGNTGFVYSYKSGSYTGGVYAIDNRGNTGPVTFATKTIS